ncbi:type II secretion system pilot lipoprotein GspS-beta [Vibrio vulnificus]|nr:type II secretion system pilot lipoprotein GspS-beta [Vibrio vulnificus]MCU8278006.1 GspS/AspS pilotin family protein [Vibrio vulnificus]
MRYKNRIIVTLTIIAILNGCQRNSLQPNTVAEYRATVISSQLPKRLGPLTLVSAISDANAITLTLVRERSVDINSLIERVAVSFCDNIEIRPLLDMGISYRIITLGQDKKVEHFNLISLETCSN